MTDEDLIDYLVGALDGESARAVEAQARSNAAVSARLEHFRARLVPLELERAPVDPPVGLAERTIARVAELPLEADAPPPVPSSTRMPRAPREEPESRTIGGRLRPDLLVACGIALVAGGLIFSAVGKVRARNEMLACQNALRVTHTGLSGYADAHNDRYPRIGPESTADSFVAALAQSGQVPQDFRAACPSCPPDVLAPTGTKAGYTYTLGFRAPGGELVGPRRPTGGADEHDLVPISADFPVPAAAPAKGLFCPHAVGMNVLFAGGHVRQTTSALIGPNGDHIFLNELGQVGAGTNRTDIVLGRPGDRP